MRQEGRCEYSFNFMTTILLRAQLDSAEVVKIEWHEQESLYVKRHDNANHRFFKLRPLYSTAVQMAEICVLVSSNADNTALGI